MRIGDFISLLHRDHVPDSGAQGSSQETSPTYDFVLDDVVQLAQDSDGVWRAAASGPPKNSATAAVPQAPGRAPVASYPMSRMYPPRGVKPAGESAKGDLLDMYG